LHYEKRKLFNVFNVSLKDLPYMTHIQKSATKTKSKMKYDLSHSGTDIYVILCDPVSEFFEFCGNILDLSGNRDLFIPPNILDRAPFHFPGPRSLYCAGKQGPHKQCKASLGSSLNKCLMFGLQPICSAISSMYSIQNVCKTIASVSQRITRWQHNIT
jgi:hypothetical protein